MVTNTNVYYNSTANDYDKIHSDQSDIEHIRALEFAWPFIRGRALSSALDVGCGTGRVFSWMKKQLHDEGHHIDRFVGVDPSENLLKIAKEKLPDCEWTLGDATNLPFEDNQFSVVTATGILHHIENPRKAISEMFRVSKDIVIISDHNNLAFGSKVEKNLKMLLFSIGLMGVASYVKQGFSKQGYSKDDGYWYPYSILTDVDLISDLSHRFFFYPTRKRQKHSPIITSAFSHGAVLCFKNE